MQSCREYLEAIGRMKRELEAIERRREALATHASGVGAIRYDKDKVQTSPANTFELSMIDMLSKTGKTDSRARYLRHEIRRRTGQIRSMGGRMGAVLYCRYVEEMPWHVVEGRMNSTLRTLYKLHTRALAKFERMYLWN